MSVFENFMEDAVIIAVQRFFTIKTCVICNEKVDVDGDFAECSKCHTIQLLAECKVCYSARVMLKDTTGTTKLTWVHDENIMNICGLHKAITPKLMLEGKKIFDNLQIVHVSIVKSDANLHKNIYIYEILHDYMSAWKLMLVFLYTFSIISSSILALYNNNL